MQIAKHLLCMWLSENKKKCLCILESKSKLRLKPKWKSYLKSGLKPRLGLLYLIKLSLIS